MKPKAENRVFVFTTKEESDDGRPYRIAIPENQIYQVKSIYGGERVYLQVNGIKVKGSFTDLVKQLGSQVNIE